MQESYHAHQSPATKICNACLQEKPLDKFVSRPGRYRDGYQPRCKDCQNERHRTYLLKRQPVKPFPKNLVQFSLFFKTCRVCEEEKPIEEFDREANGLHGHRANCKTCASKMRYEYRQEHLEEIHARDKKCSSDRYWEDSEKGETYRAMIRAARDRWQERNPDKRREHWNRYNARKKYSVPAEPVSYEAILERDGRFCYLCQRDILPDQAIHFDHVIPLARGGSHTMDNIKVTHAACNMYKSDMLLSELTDAFRRRIAQE